MYIHTLLAHPLGAFQSQFYVTKQTPAESQTHDNENVKRKRMLIKMEKI